MRHGRQGSSGTTAPASSVDDPSGCTDGRDGRSPSEARNDRPRVAVVGAGAAGTLTAVHLAAEAARRATRCTSCSSTGPSRVAASPTRRTTRGTCSTCPPAASRPYPDQPGHFVAWLRREVWHRAGPGDFAPRAEYGRYLAATLADALAAAPGVELERRSSAGSSPSSPPGDPARVHSRTTTARRRRRRGGARDRASRRPAPPGHPTALRASRRFVADPWAPGALDASTRTGAEGSTATCCWSVPA